MAEVLDYFGDQEKKRNVLEKQVEAYLWNLVVVTESQLHRLLLHRLLLQSLSITNCCYRVSALPVVVTESQHHLHA